MAIENIDKLHNVAKALMQYETLYKEKYKKAFNGEIEIEDEKVLLAKEEIIEKNKTIEL